MQFPPLVEPDAALSSAEIRRYSRHLLLPDVGLEGQQRLKSTRVLVVGAGELDSPVLLYLATAGVGTLGIVEFDVADESNLQRQVIHSVADIGRPKADSARDAIRAINPYVEVGLHAERLVSDNALAHVSQYDLVIDGTDNFATRYLVNDACAPAGKPYVWGSIFRFEDQTTVFWDAAPGGSGVNYRDLYPSPPKRWRAEAPAPSLLHRTHRRAGHAGARSSDHRTVTLAARRGAQHRLAAAGPDYVRLANGAAAVHGACYPIADGTLALGETPWSSLLLLHAVSKLAALFRAEPTGTTPAVLLEESTR